MENIIFFRSSKPIQFRVAATESTSDLPIRVVAHLMHHPSPALQPMLRTCKAMYVSMSAKHCSSPIGKQGDGGGEGFALVRFTLRACMRSGSKKMDRRTERARTSERSPRGENTCTFFLPFLISQCSQNKWTRRAIFFPPPRASIAKTEWGRDQGYISLLHFFGRSRARCCAIHR